MRIAFILPPNSDLGAVWRARALVSALVEGGAYADRIVVGLTQGDFDWDRSADRLRAISKDVEVRLASWVTVDAGVAARMHDVVSAAPEGVQQVCVPRDGGWNFRDCDVWILLTHPSMGAVAKIKPAIVYCRDLSERYAPIILADSRLDHLWEREVEGFLDWRARSHVVTATDQGLADLSAFAGVRKANCLRVPWIWEWFQPPSPRRSPLSADHILLLTSGTRRHDGAFAVEAYGRYVRDGGILPLRVAGSDALSLRPGRGNTTSFARALEDRDDDLAKRINYEVVRDDDDLADALAGARVVWSNAVADGEPDPLAIAGRAGLPFLGVQHPATEELRRRLKFTALLYPPGNWHAAAEQLAGAAAIRATNTVAQDSAAASRCAAAELRNALLKCVHLEAE